jgi:NAD(P)-dependent dehydrogenase (short-subunit alcohol dehydrogenase family)
MAMSAASGPAAIFDLHGRTALVTGASSGLGRRFAEVLADAGCRVVATARQGELLDSLAAERSGITAIVADLSSADARARLVRDAAEAVGPVDVLVNNAGVIKAGPVADETLDDFAATVEIDLVAPWHLAKLVGAGMAERGRGSIVNIASIWGVVGAAPVRASGYAAAKGGLVNLTRELAVQWGRAGVRVNAICPGWIATEMNAAQHDDARTLDVLDRMSPIPRFGRPEELDGALLLLASDAGSFMTGAVVMVDGGWTAR